MRVLALSLAIGVILVTAQPAAAQHLNLDFPELEERAEEVVDVTLDASMLRMAAKFLSKDDPEERAIREMVSGLSGIYVRSYEFAKAGQYDRTLADRVKSQLGAAWKPLVTVRSKTKENVNIMANMRGEQIVGLVIVATEPAEFTVVSIEGSINMDQLAALQGHFGVPVITKEKHRD